MRGHRPSANANGRSDSLSDLMFLYSRQHHSQTLRVCSEMFSWIFPPLMFRAGCLPPTYTLPRVCFGKARTPKEARRAAPRLFFYIQDNIIRKTLRVCSVMFSWTFAVAPLVAAPRLLKGRSVGKALPHFHSEPYVTLHPRRGFAYIRHFALRAANTFLLRTANARHGRAHQSDASAPSFSRLGAKFPLTP